MAKYSVLVTRTETYTKTIEVEAPDEYNAANEALILAVDIDTDKFHYDTCEDNVYNVAMSVQRAG